MWQDIWQHISQEKITNTYAVLAMSLNSNTNARFSLKLFRRSNTTVSAQSLGVDLVPSVKILTNDSAEAVAAVAAPSSAAVAGTAGLEIALRSAAVAGTASLEIVLS